MVRALLFDVFGTCVDWRSGVTREGTAFGKRHDLTGIDWAQFADAWRAQYQPRMNEVRSGKREWVDLDVLHREGLTELAQLFGFAHLPEDTMQELNSAWHRLDPWPDTVRGLLRLKEKYIIAPNSNGHVALILTMAKRAKIPWDLILGAQITRAYKPKPEAYLRCAHLLGLKPEEVMMVAAHNYDLEAASALGLRTGFVLRPKEHGEHQTTDLAPAAQWDVIATDFEDLATKMGCV